MPKLTKREQAIKSLVDRDKRYSLTEAVGIMKEVPPAKFAESVDLAVKLGVDPRKADQMVRGTCELPHGTGKTVRVLVIAKGEKVAEATEAGADFVGGEDMIAKIEGGWMDFDRMVATPDMMGQVGKIGKLLGPRGLMPNPKVGTVTFDVAKTVQSIKAGQVEFRVDKSGIIHVPVGRVTFDQAKIEENVNRLMETVRRLKPASTKGTYVKGVTITSTMGPGLTLDPSQFTS